MKHTWEETDLKTGTLIEKSDTKARNRFALIGYVVAANNQMTVISLDDGLQIFSGSAAELVSWLNKTAYAPVTRPVWLIDLLNHDRKPGT